MNLSDRLQIITIIVALISVFVAMAAWLFPHETYSASLSDRINTSLAKKTSKITISGSNVKLIIKKGPDIDFVKDSEIKGTGTTSIHYLSKNRVLDVKINGGNVILDIEGDIIHNVSIVDNGYNNVINEI